MFLNANFIDGMAKLVYNKPINLLLVKKKVVEIKFL